MDCKFCGNKTKEMLADIVRKADRKVAENVTVKHCKDCNASFIDLEAISFE
jgi:hypothetical protein